MEVDLSSAKTKKTISNDEEKAVDLPIIYFFIVVIVIVNVFVVESTERYLCGFFSSSSFE